MAEETKPVEEVAEEAAVETPAAEVKEAAEMRKDDFARLVTELVRAL